MDFLLDGRYTKIMHDNSSARGSTNQNLYNFEDGQAVLQDELFLSEKWSLTVTEDNQTYMAGIPKEGELAEIEENFKKIGINLEFT